MMTRSVTQDPVWMQRMMRPEVRKKAMTLIVSALLLLLNDVFELGIHRETIMLLVGLASSYMLGQGLADMGKERAIIQARAGMPEHVEVDVDFAPSMAAPSVAVAKERKAP